MDDFFNNGSFNVNNSVTNAGGNQQKPSEPNSLFHVTTAQILKHTTDQGLVIHGQRAKTICLVGFVQSIEEVTTRNTYIIKDFTTELPIDVQLWKNDPNETQAPAMSGVVENTYVRVIGQARYDEKRPYVVAFKVSPIESPLEVEEHLMETFMDVVMLEKKNQQVGSEAMDVSMAQDQNPSNALNGAPVAGVKGFDEVQKMIMNLIKINAQTATKNEGLHKDDIIQQLNINGATVEKAIAFLVDEGHLYTTKDDDTYQAVD